MILMLLVQGNHTLRTTAFHKYNLRLAQMTLEGARTQMSLRIQGEGDAEQCVVTLLSGGGPETGGSEGGVSRDRGHWGHDFTGYHRARASPHLSHCRNSNCVRSHILVINLHRVKGDFKMLPHLFIHSLFPANICGDYFQSMVWRHCRYRDTKLPSLPLSCASCSE